MNSQPAIQSFSVNAHGRDFIVGDVHGCFDQLNDALDRVKFNPEHDRCFAVGDLIDRGPYSEMVLEWLAQPWFYSCRGNHEQMLLEDDMDNPNLIQWLESYGGEWWLALSPEARTPYREAVAKLPYAIELQTAHGSVGLIHADVPQEYDWPDFKAQIDKQEENCLRQVLWGRKRIKSLLPKKVKGIDRLVCGHTITNGYQIKKSANIWFIDTGAYLNNKDSRLTLLDVEQLFL